MRKKPFNPIDVHVGARVRMRRTMLHLSQENLAAALDLTFQQVQKYEKGANRIGASRLQQIALALKVPPAFFFEGLPVPGATGGNAARLVEAFFSLRGAAELARAFIALPADQRRLLADLAAALSPARSARKEAA